MELEKIRELQAKQEEERRLKEEFERNAKQFLDNDALVRYGNLKSAFPEISLQIAMIINQLAQEGQLNRKLNDMEFKELLKNLNPKKREIKITRK